MAMTNGPNTARPELLDDQLADRSGAEKQLLQGPPKMALAATHEELRDAFEAHVEGTHVQDGGSEEGTNEAAIDASRKAGQHENSSYGCLDTWAEQLNWHDVPVRQEGTTGENERTDARPDHIVGSVHGAARTRKERNWWKRMGTAIRPTRRGSYRTMSAPVRKPRRNGNARRAAIQPNGNDGHQH